MTAFGIKRYLNIGIFVFALLFFKINPAAAAILMEPYLQAGTQTSMIVMVESDTKNPVLVYYGTTEKLGTSVQTTFFKDVKGKKKRFVHRIKLTGLTPNTKYFYQATQDGDESKIYSFTTAPLPGTSFKIGVMGDFRNNPEMHSLLAKEIKKHNPIVLLYTGDLCGNGSYASWKEEFFVPGELELLPTAPMFNGLGNHENYGDLTDVFLQAPNSPSDNEYYYSIDYGDLHVVVINTEGDMSKNGKQWKFIEQDLKSTDKIFKMALFHKPAYSSGSHGGNKDMQLISRELLVPYGVCAAINGHTHYYQKNMVDGMYHLILAGGGAPLYEPKPADYVLKSVKDFHYSIFDVSPEKIDIKVFDLYGKILDEFSILPKGK